MLLVIRATSVCHHLCGSVLEQRQRGLRASGATAHVCSQALSTSTHFAITSGPNWNILSPQPPLTPIFGLILWFQHKTDTHQASSPSHTTVTSKTHPQTEGSVIVLSYRRYNFRTRHIHAKQTYWLPHHCKIWRRVPFKLQCCQKTGCFGGEMRLWTDAHMWMREDGRDRLRWVYVHDSSNPLHFRLTMDSQ